MQRARDEFDRRDQMA